MTTRPAFRHIASPLDVSDADLEKLNDQLGVPSLVTPTPTKPGTGQGLAQGEAPKTASRPSPTRKPATHTTATSEYRPLATEVRMAVTVPDYLRDAVNLRAAQERCTSRYIVMKALLAVGFEIDPADLMADGRHTPKKA